MNRFTRLTLLLALVTALFVMNGCTVGQVAKPGATGSQTLTETQAVEVLRTNPVYFAYDRYDLDTAARNDLRQKSDILKQFPRISMQIEGHCDERGTEEYNLALGERRARAVYDYLLMLGVPASQLSTHSYGKMYPAVQGNSEAAWSKNRRAEFNASR
ncbi:MAG: peptidoglycan-associated lipoprotein Pal [Deltaproteobacteria bacterium]|jgi:peptidoglycan-associated lipoprotein|nr:peptidoglycan-associated lipoprotein Pal [Deltaproteobacteria bacterium]